jgi:hypothetical protein
VLPDGQKLIRGWDRGWTQDGQALRVRGTGLAAGDRVDTGFDASYRTATTLPAQFRLNGTVCAAEMSIVGATTPATRSAGAATVTRAAPVKAAPAKAGPAKAKAGPAKGKAGEGKAKGNKGKGKGKGKK